MNELLACAIFAFLAPYVLGPPIAIAWVGLALALRATLGWTWLLPADVWSAAR